MVKKVVICLHSASLSPAKSVCPWVRTVQSNGTDRSHTPHQLATGRVLELHITLLTQQWELKQGCRTRQLDASDGYDYVRRQHTMLDDELQRGPVAHMCSDIKSVQEVTLLPFNRVVCGSDIIGNTDYPGVFVSPSRQTMTQLKKKKKRKEKQRDIASN